MKDALLAILAIIQCTLPVAVYSVPAMAHVPTYAIFMPLILIIFFTITNWIATIYVMNQT